MADIYQKGETIICWRNVKDDTGAYTDPSTSMTITISDSVNGIEVNKVNMTKDTTGKYHYDYSIPETARAGKYSVKYIATDDLRVTIYSTSFEVE